MRLLWCLAVLAVLDASALVLTNGPDANVTAPDDPHVGWQFVADNGPFTACGPRLFCSVQHVGWMDPVFHGQQFFVDRVVEPPGSDVRFLIVDRDVPEFASIFMCPTNPAPVLQKLWIVGAGVGTGQAPDGTNFYWGADGPWPTGSQRLRWGWSDGVMLAPVMGLFAWRSDMCGSSSGDSGYATFTEDGHYLGPIQFGHNPVTVGEYQSGGAIASNYLDWLAGEIPPRPRTAQNLSVHAP